MRSKLSTTLGVIGCLTCSGCVSYLAHEFADWNTKNTGPKRVFIYPSLGVDASIISLSSSPPLACLFVAVDLLPSLLLDTLFLPYDLTHPHATREESLLRKRVAPFTTAPTTDHRDPSLMPATPSK